MQELKYSSWTRMTTPLLLALLVLTQQVVSSPFHRAVSTSPGSDDGPGALEVERAPVLRRVARMSPLWRLMNSKPLGAYCHSNYECSTGLCRAGHCSTTHRAMKEPAKY
ncbi:liver-expressed antimicrobial peptide 2 [Gadus morhua]|uniref:liver-expressed antimicrobial peptide 2 n=1 Tax=Gadus morhua TaxID=8049 RepID=UPI0011B5E0F0|nr:liver-expressed antimicrobial peptide 2-like [Gadus morhua]XP_030194884.1 liver-expressed antimicrobial peptide 2-like [Gadus morhua]